MKKLFLLALISFTITLFYAFEKSDTETSNLVVERVTTIAPFPRGLDMIEGKLYVLCRGRVRGAGGVSAEIEDQAGTLYLVDPNIAEPYTKNEPSEAIMKNGKVFALPTAPPFNLWNRAANPPENDRFADRPYCSLRYHDATKSFYICAFSGIDKPKKPGASVFSKNLSDAVLRYDLRTQKWYEVERHNIEAGGNYPQNDPAYSKPPHGWLNGPDNCLTVGNYLYAVAKDNSVMIRYDLSKLTSDTEAGYPKSEWALGSDVYTKNSGMIKMYGHSALAVRDNYLYVASRTSSHIIRVKLNADGSMVLPYEAELVALFKPYDHATGESANITDMDFDSKGRLYLISAEPSRVFRFTPDPKNIYDATQPTAKPWCDLSLVTENPKMKSENVFVDVKDRVFVTSGDGYAYQKGAFGTVYRIVIPD
ncbi:MAG: hypothetical protein SH857_17480 [Chitinophagales bacterium]|nr:hypothetical protein [Chitinophagales bacterium]